MKEQQISILSDLHTEFYIRQKDPKRIKPKDVEIAYRGTLSADPAVDLLIVAGDLGSYLAQGMQVLHHISTIFNYKKILVTAGNHTSYASSQLASRRKEHAFANYKDPQGIIEVLEGTVVNYKGIRYGGCEMNYDGSYLKVLQSELDPVDYWKYYMNDSKYQHRGGYLLKYFNELTKLREVYKKSDVIITHINPSNKLEHQLEQYRQHPSTAFYNFDGEQLLKDTTAKYWIYGHCHGQYSYTQHGVECILNAHGYPSEPKKALTITIRI
jgi:hypothetical protein